MVIGTILKRCLKRSRSIVSDVRIATRRSPLAIAQADSVARRITAAHPGIEVELVKLASSGDTDLTTPVTTLTEVGAFVRAVQRTVMEGDADMAVHSCKDLPVAGPDELIAFYPERQSPWDVLCGSTLDDLTHGARVGTGSPRRAAQIRMLRPDIEVSDIRGNVGSRLAKVESGEYEAVVLAHAGLVRLGRESEASQVFKIEEMIPAPGQGVIAVEALQDSEAARLLARIDDPACRLAAESERWLLALTGAGCRSALGALAYPSGDEVTMTGFVDEGSGPRRATAAGPDASEVASLVRQGLGL